MLLDSPRVRDNLKSFDFTTLFIEELGWDHYENDLELPLEEQFVSLKAVAEKHGMVVFTCDHSVDGHAPDYNTRRKIEQQVSKSAFEHLIIFINPDKTSQIWQWVRREPGKPRACREHIYHCTQPGDALIQKLQAIAFSFEEEEGLSLVGVTSRVRAAFDVERVTKLFYELFKKEQTAFLKFIKGITDKADCEWYASVMLNRLMFIYFIQKKGFLDDDPDYLRNRLKTMQKKKGRDKFFSFYHHFLLRLFHEGLGQKDRTAELDELLGKVPYLNGGLFLLHPIEERHPDIQIPDKAFERIFDFFDQYRWHLDERPLRTDNEINPDVLGYIFEKYINQKQMGAYYTKEDITDYISKNTIIPFIFGEAQKNCKVAFEGKQSIWRLLQSNPNRYIYNSVKHGIHLPLPKEIANGIDNIAKRSHWNKPAPAEFALPTEIWREVVARRQRYHEAYHKIEEGEFRSIECLTTSNLDLHQFAQDVIENYESADFLVTFYEAITKISILDPACGSGAFLFAALNILEPLYDACLSRMEAFLSEQERLSSETKPGEYLDFREALEQVGNHPNRSYFILKSIIVSNLFGVDIMEEAVEICKLRLFLKLVAQVDAPDDLEPLPDIDFNIRSGNTLVGFTTYDEVRKAITSKLDFGNTMAQIEAKAEDIEHLSEGFRRQQIEYINETAQIKKHNLQDSLNKLKTQLDVYLAEDYGNNLSNDKWLNSHQPFHWFIEFYGIIKKGGFDVIIGNPPYVEYSKIKRDYTIRDYKTEKCGNLYAFFVERATELLMDCGGLGFIIPVASICTDGYKPLQELLMNTGDLVVSSFNDRPGKLFDGLEHIRLCVILCHKRQSRSPSVFSTKYNKWQTIERPNLFSNLVFVMTAMIADGSIPKLSTETEKSILEKVLAQRKSLSFYARKFGKHSIFYTRKLSGFVQILDFVPAIYDKNDHRREPSELKRILISSRKHRDMYLALLNSNLFYWLITINSDCRNLNKREVYSICFDIDKASTKTVGELSKLTRDLMADFKHNSKMVEMNYKSKGRMNIQCIYPKYSKPIIDKIDTILGQHYGFTEEELDFIINYDIKYRMGGEN